MTGDLRADISFPEFLRLVLDSRIADVHVALPGVVKSYSPEKQTADVQPQIKRHLLVEDGTTTVEDLPILPGIRVGTLRGGGYFVHVPVQVGDHVLVIFAERDLGEWRRLGSNVDPADQRTHSLAGAYALPAIWPDTDLIPNLDGSALEIGSESGLRAKFTATTMEVGGSSDAAARASKVDDLYAKFNAHTHTDPQGGSTSTPTPTYTGGTTASSKLKVGG